MNYKLLALTALSSHLVFAQSTMLETITVNEIVDEKTDTVNKTLKVKEKGQSNNIADFIEDDTEISLNKKANYGDNGSNFLLRGQSANRVALNVDGNNINSIGGMGASYIDFSSIPMDNFEKIEIIKGGSSVEYGHVLGGVINAYTKKPKEKPHFSLYTTTGGWDGLNDYSNIRASFAKRYGNFGISLAAGKQKSDPYLWNNDYESDSLSTRFYYFTPNEGEISLGVLYSDTTRGLIKNNRKSIDPANSNFNKKINSSYPLGLGEDFAGASPFNEAFSVIGEGANARKKKTLLDISYKQPIFEDAIFEISAFKNKEDRKEKNYADSSKSGTTFKTGDLVFERDVDVDDSYGVKTKTTLFLEEHELLFGAEYKNLKGGQNTITYMNTEYNTSNGFGSNKNGDIGKTQKHANTKLKGFFLSDRYEINDNFSFLIGARYDEYDANHFDFKTKDSKLTPKLGLEYLSDDNSLFAIYAYQTFRAPGSPEISHYIDGVREKNELKSKPLKAENANAIDIVYKKHFSSGNFFKTSLFYYDVKDYIIFKTLIGEGRFAYNIDKATFLGTTISGHYKINNDFFLNAAITYQKTKKKGDPLDPNNISTKIDYVPNLQANLSLNYLITSKFTTNLAFNYTGTRYYEQSDVAVKKLDDYITTALSLKYRATKHSVFELYGENIFDKKYESTFGTSTIGRVIGISYKYLF